MSARPPLLAGAVLALAGCSGITPTQDEVNRVHVQTDVQLQDARDRTESMARRDGAAVRRSSGQWLGLSVERRRGGDPLPFALRTSHHRVVVAGGDPGDPSRRYLIEEVEHLLGVEIAVDPVSVHALRLVRSAESETASVGQAVGPTELPPEGLADPLEGAGSPLSVLPDSGFSLLPPVGPQRLAGESSSDSDAEIGDIGHAELDFNETFLLTEWREGHLDTDFRHEGSASGLLDAVARALGFSGWRYESGRVLLHRHVERQFPYDFQVAQGSGMLDALVDGLRIVCGGCPVKPRVDLGVLHVVFDPVLVDRVDTYMARWNRKLSQQYHIELNVYRLLRNAGDRTRLDWSELVNLTDFELVAGSVPAEGVTAPSGPGIFFSDNDASFRSALATVADEEDVSTVYSTSFLTLQARTHVIDAQTEEQVKIAQKSSTRDNVSTASTSDDEELQKFSSGLRFSLTPVRLGGDRISLAYEMELHQSPEYEGEFSTSKSLRSRQQRHTLANEVVVPLGARLVFTAFERSLARSQSEGVLHPDFWLLGGGSNVSRRIETVFVTLLIRPVDLRGAPSPAGDVSGPGMV